VGAEKEKPGALTPGLAVGGSDEPPAIQESGHAVTREFFDAPAPRRRSPSFQFYADDFYAGAAELSQAETGAYIRLLCRQWSIGSIPSAVEKMERIAGGPVTADVLEKFPVGADGQRRNQRLEHERQKQADYREMQRAKGIKSGEARRTSVEPRLNHGSIPVGAGLEPKANSPSPSPSPSSVFTEGKGASRFSPTSLDEVKAEAAKIGLPAIEAEKFFGHYQSNGWRVGRNPMRSWRAALNNWKLRSYDNNRTSGSKPNPRNAGLPASPGYSDALSAKVARQQARAGSPMQ
jgi:uncharacterized protein YdaU (DUF1376 family)